LVAAILQEPTGGETTGIVQGAAETAKEIPRETGVVLSSVKTFFTSIIGYLTSPTFIGHVVGTVIVIALAVVFYRVAVRLIPRILTWHRPVNETHDPATLARIRR